MTIIDFVRLILRHLVLLILVPFLLASLVIVLTMNPSFEYTSQTILYTGLATGSSIEMDKTFNYQATNTAFDNLINIIDSRETQEEVAIRLLAQHLMLPEANPKYISKGLFDEFKNKIPKDLYNYVETSNNYGSNLTNITDYDNSLFPSEINKNDYEKTVQNLTDLMKSSNDNFVYELLNYGKDKHYSLKAISEVTAMRISSSDLMKLTYTVDDPGICQQTLAIYNRVCIKNYKNVKENRSDDVVKYFENQLALAKNTLQEAEDKLLEFNKSSNIINYYEQSKAVAIVKEDMEVNFKNKTAELAGIEAATKSLEEKLEIQDIIQKKSNGILEKKQELGDINYKIALMQAEIESNNNEQNTLRLQELQKEFNVLTKAIKKGVDEIYTYQNTIEGLPVSKVLPDWMNNVVEAENLRAELKIINEQQDSFQEKYAEYAPAGATITRIEREISVSEQGYLEILHGLNLAKLKLQDNALSANLKTIDRPFYPLSPNPTKRSILIIAAAFLGAILTLGIIVVMEYFDDTLRNSTRATKKIGLSSLGMIPKIILDSGSINLTFIQNRLIDIISQNILQFFSAHTSENKIKTIVVFSTQKMEGKTVIAGNIAKTLKKEGKKILLINYDGQQEPIKQQIKFPLINKILRYPDPRIDFNNPFLAHVSSYLDTNEYGTYSLNNTFYNAKSYSDILESNHISSDHNPDFIIIELPALIYNNYPSELINNADLGILVCRSNRIWSEADQTAMGNLMETTASKIKLIVNGVSINEIESVLGDLPKKRTKLRKKIKAMFKFQFFSKNQI
jgi:uncharacterized protein involved in exopolysaccharide biosynthesis